MRPLSTRAGFTLVELLLVMVVILILAGIVLAISGSAQSRAARARATAEIEALRNGLERYRVDNAAYPSAPTTTDALDPRTAFDPTDNAAYIQASRALYSFLTGQLESDGGPSQNPSFPPPAPAAGARIYFDQFKPGMLAPMDASAGISSGVAFIKDPWGSSYGYSTAYQAALDSGGTGAPAQGYSPGYDLWSVAGRATKLKGPIKNAAEQNQWIKTW